MDLGVGPGTAVALYLPNTPYHPIAFFAVLRCGGRIVHLSPLDAERELAFKLQGLRRAHPGDHQHRLHGADGAEAEGRRARRSICRCRRHRLRAVGDTHHTDRRRRPHRPLRQLREEGAGKLPRQWPQVGVEDIALLQYTGGTTGKPKGAMLTHGNLSAACSIYKLWADPQNISEPGEDRVICVLPLFHIYALTSVMLRCLREGNELMLRVRFDAQTTLNDIEVKKATVFPGVPTMWIALANLPGIDRRDLSSLRYVASGGAPLPVDVAERFQKLTGHRIGGGWGMTETSPAGTAMPREWTGKAGSVGLPLPGIDMDIVALDDPRRAAEAGREGRDPHQGAERHQGLLERAGGDGRRVRRRLAADRRHRHHGRGRLFLSRRPQEGHDHLRRVQRLPERHRGGDLRASGRGRSQRDRRTGQLPRRGRQGLRAAEARRRAPSPSTSCASSSPTRLANTRCPPIWNSAMPCRRPPSASCRRKS